MSLPHDVLFLKKKVPLVTNGHGLDEEAAGVAGNEQVELVRLWFPSIAPFVLFVLFYLFSTRYYEYTTVQGGNLVLGGDKARERREKVKRTGDPKEMHQDAPSRELLPEA